MLLYLYAKFSIFEDYSFLTVGDLGIINESVINLCYKDKKILINILIRGQNEI